MALSTDETVVSGAGNPVLRGEAQPEEPSQDLSGGSIRRSAAMSSSYQSALDALDVDERQRNARFARVSTVLLLATAAVLPLFGGHPTLRWCLAGGLVLALVADVFVEWMLRNPERYSEDRIGLAWLASAPVIVLANLYFGVLSPAAALLVYCTYFFGLSQNTHMAWAFFVFCMGFVVTMAVLTTSALVVDPGVLSGEGLTQTQRLCAFVLILVILGGIFYLARGSRQASIAAISHLADAVRESSRREALLDEARFALERALQIGGEGRFSGHILGNFELGAILGRGAMGEVYEAQRLEDNVPAAVKLLRAEVLDRSDYVRRFIREAEIVSRIQSEHIVKVLEVGGTEAEFPYIAMERLEGEDLGALLRRKDLSTQKIVAMIEQVARGIESAWEAGVVHRDLKPENLFHSSGAGGSQWKVLDFGVSKLAHSAGTLTQGHIVGTPAYMAPEQALGREVDNRADVYSLAAIAYRCLTGHAPFRGSDVISMLQKVAHEMPRRPRELNPSLSPGVEEVLLQGLSKEPESRPKNAQEFAGRLRQAVGRAREQRKQRAATSK